MPPTNTSGPCLGADVEERLADEREEGTLARRQLGRLEPAPDDAGAETLADELLLQVLAGPGDEARIDRLVEPEDPLRHAARRRDHDDHHARRLEREHLDVPDRRGLERRRRDEREQPRRVREHVGRRAQRLLDLVAHRAKVDAEPVGSPLERVDELVGVDAVAALRRRSTGGRVRVRQQPERLELGELAAHGRGRDAEAGALDEHARSDRLARRDVLLDDPPQDLALPRGELHLGPMVAADPAGSRPRSGHELGGHAAAEEASAPREAELLAAPVRSSRSTRSRSTSRVSASRSSASSTSATTTRLVEPEAEQQALASARLVVDRLDLARRASRPAASAST